MSGQRITGSFSGKPFRKRRPKPEKQVNIRASRRTSDMTCPKQRCSTAGRICSWWPEWKKDRRMSCLRDKGRCCYRSILPRDTLMLRWPGNRSGRESLRWKIPRWISIRETKALQSSCAWPQVWVCKKKDCQNHTVKGRAGKKCWNSPGSPE